MFGKAAEEVGTGALLKALSMCSEPDQTMQDALVWLTWLCTLTARILML